jgi:hypothetical protein
MTCFIPSQAVANRVIAPGAGPMPGIKDARQAEDIVGAVNGPLTRVELAAPDAAS